MVAAPVMAEVPGQTVTALYEVISGPKGEKRDWDRFQSLFTPDAQMVIASRLNGQSRISRITPQQYVERSGPVLEGRGFFEKEVRRQTSIFGGVCTIVSHYEMRFDVPTGQPADVGTNHIQLVRVGDEWRIASIAWSSQGGGYKGTGG